MKKSNKIYIPLFLSMAVALGILIGSNLDYPKKNSVMFFNKSPQEAKIKRLIDYIQYDYVDKVNTDSLLDGTIKQILGKLDPHSVYIPASEHGVISERMNGEFVGVGIQFRMLRDSLTVINVVKDGPSEKAGIKAGDRILMADNDSLYGKNLESDYIIKKLKGEPRTKVDLMLYRKTEAAHLPITVKRGKVPIKSVDAYYMLNDSLGYVKINKFASTTYKEFMVALKSLKDQEMKRLVLDLRGNPGGYLGVATQIVDEFLEDDKLIVFTKNKGGKIDRSYATKKGSFEDGKVYVLIDEVSASASEIIAGALQDNDKGTIVGRRSFGKGLVQQEMELGDGSVVRLTVSRYYTPTGRSIQKPYEGGNGRSYYNDIALRFNNGELTSADSIKVVDSLKFETPKGKVVYGGGGIVPDVFVSIDTTFFINGAHFRILPNYVFDYVDNRRNEFKGLSYNDFKSNFDEDGAILKGYLDMLDSDYNITIQNVSYLKLYMKSSFAQLLFDDNAFYEILNLNDNMLKRVKELETNIDYIKP